MVTRSLSSPETLPSSAHNASVSQLSNTPPAALIARCTSDVTMNIASGRQRLADCGPVKIINMTGYRYDLHSGRSHSFTRQLSFSQKDFLVLAEEEELGIKITTGGSGASVFSLSNEQDQPILRKIMPNHRQDPHMLQEKTQDAEAKAGAVLLGFERTPSMKHHALLEQVLLEKKQVIADFVRETRPVILSRFILTEQPQALSGAVSTKITRIGVGYDQSLVTDAEGNPAKPFSSIIENENQALSEYQLNSFVQTQLQLTEKLYIAQEKIYLSEPLSVEEGLHEFQKSYCHRLSSRVLEPLKEGKFEDVTLHLGKNGSEEITLNLHSLLSQPEIIVNNQIYSNPLHLLIAHQELQLAARLGFLLHGDLQQSNAIYVKDSSEEARLVCIDNRPPDIKDALFDLIKILWGPAFLPVLDDHMRVDYVSDLGWRYYPRTDFAESKKNFERFNDCFTAQLLQSETMQCVLEKNPHWQSHVNYCMALQFICDLGFIIPELKNAKANEDEARVTRLSQRILADFIEAAQITADWSK
jgi:hypothetical protein